MLIWVSWIIAGAISMYAYYYEYNSLFEKNHRLRKKEIILFCLLTLFNSFVINILSSSVRIIFTIVSIIILLKYCFKEKIEKIIIFSILAFIVMAISEIIYSVVFVLILNIDLNFLKYNFLGILITNICITLIFLFINKCKKVQSIIKYIIKWYENKKLLNLLVMALLYMVTINMLLYQNTLVENSRELSIIINDIYLLCLIVFVVIHFNEKSTNSELTYKYDNLLDYAKTYEQEVVEKSKWQHEYENQLIIVKDKISKNNKEAREYINQLLKNKPVDINSEWLRKLSKFPDIGIKGLLCYKIGQMQTKGVNVFVDISENLKIKRIHKQVLEKNLQDISRILGVYIDNAIDAACESKAKYFIFEFYCTNENLVFQISNTFSGSLDLQKMGNEQFTTKGKGHGCGLSLVKDIIEKNSLISQEREINGKYYVQRLIVNVKNNKSK